MSDSTIRTRFAPSPTGMLHVGGARTALFNYLFAKNKGGEFLLRVEDSDRERSTTEAVQVILDGLAWLGISFDRDPVFQSERNELYQKYAKKLLESGAAYPCTVSAEELDAMRDEQMARGEKPKYDGRCRPDEIIPQDPTLPSPGDAAPFTIRLRTPQKEPVVFDDQVLGRIETPSEELDDFILIRSDGTPTYNFVNVVDDIEMKISHVLRGNEHVANTARQIAIYEALAQPLPVFAHFPLILGEDKKKLSKRHGATAVIEYRKDGYLAQGFNNYIARLGWSAGDREIFSAQELIEAFSLEGIGKSPSVFDTEKLRWVNGEHLRGIAIEELRDNLLPFLDSVLSSGSAAEPEALLEVTNQKALLQAAAERSKTLLEVAESLSWLNDDYPVTAKQKQIDKAFGAAQRDAFARLKSEFESQPEFQAEDCEASFNRILEKFEIGFGKLGSPLRIAVTGSAGGISLFTILEALGKERTVARMTEAEALFAES